MGCGTSAQAATHAQEPVSPAKNTGPQSVTTVPASSDPPAPLSSMPVASPADCGCKATQADLEAHYGLDYKLFTSTCPDPACGQLASRHPKGEVPDQPDGDISAAKHPTRADSLMVARAGRGGLLNNGSGLGDMNSGLGGISEEGGDTFGDNPGPPPAASAGWKNKDPGATTPFKPDFNKANSRVSHGNLNRNMFKKAVGGASPISSSSSSSSSSSGIAQAKHPTRPDSISVRGGLGNRPANFGASSSLSSSSSSSSSSSQIAQAKHPTRPDSICVRGGLGNRPGNFGANSGGGGLSFGVQKKNKFTPSLGALGKMGPSSSSSSPSFGGGMTSFAEVDEEVEAE